MEKSRIAFVVSPVLAVAAIYEAEGTSPSTFKTFDKTLKKDDLIAVTSSTRHGVTICKVTEVDVTVDLDANSHIGWVVCRIDMTEHKQNLAEEEAAIVAVQKAERQRKISETRASLLGENTGILDTLAIAQKDELVEPPEPPVDVSKS